MDLSVYDIFSGIRNILYLGNYQGTTTEIDATEINEEDAIQIVKKKFYLFMGYLEDNKQNELNDLLSELKDSEHKMYYSIFRFYTIFFLKGQYKSESLDKMYNDMVSIENPSMILQPAMYIIALILFELDDRERFLSIISRMPDDIELQLLKVFYLIKIFRYKEAAELSSIISSKDSDSIPAQLIQVLICLLKDGNVEKAITTLGDVKKNNAITPKLFNFIGTTVMFKGGFNDAIKPLMLGVDFCEKNCIAMNDLACLYVNLICCYRNLGMENEVRDYEEKLRSTYPGNKYFIKMKQFEDEMDKILKTN